MEHIFQFDVQIVGLIHSPPHHQVQIVPILHFVKLCDIRVVLFGEMEATRSPGCSGSTRESYSVSYDLTWCHSHKGIRLIRLG
jgi:hypothetical protein